jgi:hypothetical protein
VPRAKRGEIWVADLGLAAKVRPVLILSVAYEGQERVIVSYVIRTTSLRGTQYEVRHETRGMPNGAFVRKVWVRYRRSNSKGAIEVDALPRLNQAKAVGFLAMRFCN